jgi:hypothetical protein
LGRKENYEEWQIALLLAGSSLQERWPKRTHKLLWYSTPGCISTPPQCHHWWMITLHHKKIWNGRTVCISIGIRTHWCTLAIAFYLASNYARNTDKTPTYCL